MKVVPVDDPYKAGLFSEFDALGPEHVRLRIEKNKFAGLRLSHAIEWLAAKDQESRVRSEASSDDQIQITRSAKNAAWAAAIAAIVAAIVAIVAAVISFAALSRIS